MPGEILGPQIKKNTGHSLRKLIKEKQLEHITIIAIRDPYTKCSRGTEYNLSLARTKRSERLHRPP